VRHIVAAVPSSASGPAAADATNACGPGPEPSDDHW